MTPIQRSAVAGLALSVAVLVGIFTSEDYTDAAIVPTQGDRPTAGFGSTVREDGSAVRMGDRTNPVKAARMALVHVQRNEPSIYACIGSDVKLFQAEYDVYADLAYNIAACLISVPGHAWRYQHDRKATADRGPRRRVQWHSRLEERSGL